MGPLGRNEIVATAQGGSLIAIDHALVQYAETGRAHTEGYCDATDPNTTDDNREPSYQCVGCHYCATLVVPRLSDRPLG